MSRHAYVGRPALVARYRHDAPAPVQVVALIQYLVAMCIIVAAVLATLIVSEAGSNVDGDRLPDSVRRGVAGGGLVIPITLAVLGFVWLVIARGLQRGRQWARITVLMLSVLAIAGIAYDRWRWHDPHALVGLALPGLQVMLLDTAVSRSWFRDGVWVRRRTWSPR
jgi:hypothetical protein